MIVGDGESKVKKRPVWVWIISIFMLLSAGWTLLIPHLLVMKAGSVPLNFNPARQAYFSDLTTVDDSLSLLVAFANLIGAITLFLLRKVAVYFFASVLFANLTLTAWNALTKSSTAAISGPGFVGAIMGWALLTAICLYSWKLSKAGVLT
jgi:hypothetical protein